MGSNYLGLTPIIFTWEPTTLSCLLAFLTGGTGVHKRGGGTQQPYVLSTGFAGATVSLLPTSFPIGTCMSPSNLHTPGHSSKLSVQYTKSYCNLTP